MSWKIRNNLAESILDQMVNSMGWADTQVKISDDRIQIGVLSDPIVDLIGTDSFPRSSYRISPIDIKLNLEKIGFIRRNQWELWDPNSYRNCVGWRDPIVSNRTCYRILRPGMPKYHFGHLFVSRPRICVTLLIGELTFLDRRCTS